MVRQDRLHQLVAEWLGARGLAAEASREINPPAHRFDIAPSGAVLLIHDAAAEDYDERALLDAIGAASDHVATSKSVRLAGDLSLRVE